MSNFYIKFFYFINSFGNVVFIPILLVLIIGALFIFDRHKREFVIILFSILSYPYSLLLKMLFRRTRPEFSLESHDSILDFYSFPSSHVVYYVAFWGYILYLCFKMRHEPKVLRIISGVFSSLMILFVGISRVIVGAHWPSDVIGGYFFGAVFLAFLILADQKMKLFKSDDNLDSRRPKRQKSTAKYQK